jgi:hypothetical protein
LPVLSVFGLLDLLFTLLVVGLLLNVTANRFPIRVVPAFMRWGWFSVAIYATIRLMTIDAIQQWLRGAFRPTVLSFVIAATVGAIVGILYWAVVSAKVEKAYKQEEPQLAFQVGVLKDPHPNGVMLAEIPWREHYVDIRLDIINGPIQIQNLELVIAIDRRTKEEIAMIQQGKESLLTPTVLIRAMSQLSQIPNVTMIPKGGPIDFLAAPNDRDGKPLGITIPVAGSGGAAGAYRLYCPVLYRDTPLRLVMAGTSLDSPPEDSLPPENVLMYVPGPRRFPRKIEIQGSYDTTGPNAKHYPVQFSQELASPEPAGQVTDERQRRLSDDQKKQLIKILKDTRPDVPVIVRYVQNDLEGSNFAREFLDILKAAGWKTGARPIDAGDRTANGLAVEILRNKPTPVSATILAKALKDVGLTATLRINRDVRKNQVALRVGRAT